MHLWKVLIFLSVRIEEWVYEPGTKPGRGNHEYTPSVLGPRLAACAVARGSVLRHTVGAVQLC